MAGSSYFDAARLITSASATVLDIESIVEISTYVQDYFILLMALVAIK